MWDQILNIFLVAHVLAGFIAAFLAFPIAALATKGGQLHRWSGLLFVGCFFFICIFFIIANIFSVNLQE